MKERVLFKYNHEITSIIILAFGVLVFLSLYIQNSIGIFGTFIRELLIGLIGLPAFLIPLILIIYAVLSIFKRDDTKFRLRVLYTFILMLVISALIQTANYKVLDYENVSLMGCIAKFYQEVQGNMLFVGGGVLGGLLSTPFLLMFQVLGTIIILTTIAIIDIILLTNISIANFIRNIKGLFVKSYKLSKESIKKVKVKSSGIGEAAGELGAVGNNGKLNFDFKPGKKVLDFKIEKTSRELKEKTDNLSVKTDDTSNIEEPVEFIMKDFKNNSSIASNKTKTIQDNGLSVAKEVELNEEDISDYKFPTLEMLNENNTDGIDLKELRNTALEGAKKLEETLRSFGVEAKVINISRGPAVTRYELQPNPGVKVSKIVSLSDDISLNLASSGVRIEAPIPGKAAVGIEVANKEVVSVCLKEIIESDVFTKFQSKLAFSVGKDISGECIVADIAKMPHLLIAGATGAGKSVCINSIIISLLYKASPKEVKLLMIDPKVVELGVYNGIPHLLIPVVTEPKKAAGALNWAVQEMITRYKQFAEKGVRDIKGYNQVLKEAGNNEILPQIVIIIDELADLMMVAPNDVEDAICRLAQMARAAGMHLVIATQRPSVDVITGIIKANIPSRISFAVSSQVDSRTILDMAGAEKLLGKGDMLFYPVGQPKPIRVKGSFVTEKEVERVVAFIKSQSKADYNEDIIEEINNDNDPYETNVPGDCDELLNQSIEMVIDAGQASVSLIQRKFKVGYALSLIHISEPTRPY